MSTTSVVYNISIDADQILEVDEMFEIVINLTSLPFDVFSGVPDEVLLVIVDDDRKLQGKSIFRHIEMLCQYFIIYKN